MVTDNKEVSKKTAGFTKLKWFCSWKDLSGQGHNLPQENIVLPFYF